MPYVIRDTAGQVVGMAEIPLDDDAEDLPGDHPEVLSLVARTCATESGGDDNAFVASDLDFIRVLEDLIEILIKRGVITLSDLPAAAQDKLRQRRALRSWLAGVGGLVDGSAD